MGLSSQQSRLVRLLLSGVQDKETAQQMSLRMPTIRTYLSRLFSRTGATDRVRLLILVFEELLEDCRRNGRHRK